MYSVHVFGYNNGRVCVQQSGLILYYSVHVFGYNNGRVCIQQSGLILYSSVMCLGTTMEEYAYNSQGSYCTIVCMCLGTTIWLLFMYMYKGMLLQVKPNKVISRGVFQDWVMHTNNYCGMSCA